MKKYLMTGLAAIAFGAVFTGCSNDFDNGNVSVETTILENYENAFVTRFGQPTADQDWGFGDGVAGTRSGNMAGQERVAETSTGINANANEWADKADAPHGHGGWLVPDPLTAEQKTIVTKYFQTHPDLTYEDPHFNNFFVQQVYKGGTGTVEQTTEGIKGANGTQYSSSNMNLLTVGYNNQHINNFNGGSYGTEDGQSGVGVLDNGYTVNEFDAHHHPDQIMLMVNIDDTGCMGYHCSATGVTLQRNDKAALVGWQTIATWANANGMNGNCLNDGWDRSFVGFDLALKSKEEVVLNDVLMLNQVQSLNNMKFVWDGTQQMKLGEPTTTAAAGQEVDILSYFAYCYNGSVTNDGSHITFKSTGYGGLQSYGFGNYNNWSSYSKFVIEFSQETPNDAKLELSGAETVQIPAGTTKYEIDLTGKNYTNVSGGTLVSDPAATFEISKIYLVGGGDAPQEVYYDSEYVLVDGKQIHYIDANTNQYAGDVKTFTDADFQITIDGNLGFNLKKVIDLVHDGYLPVSGSAMKEWAKWEDSDGYFSDWIVTLNKAKRTETTTETTTTPTGFVCRIIAEDLTVGENSDFDFNDVVFDVINGGTTLRLRAAGGTLPLYVAGREVHAAFGKAQTEMVNTGWDGKAIDYENYYVDIPSGGTYSTREAAENIPVVVTKNGQNITLRAPKGKVASKVCVGSDYKWCRERGDIDGMYHTKSGVRLFTEYVKGNYGSDWYQHVND